MNVTCLPCNMFYTRETTCRLQYMPSRNCNYLRHFIEPCSASHRAHVDFPEYCATQFLSVNIRQALMFWPGISWQVSRSMTLNFILC